MKVPDKWKCGATLPPPQVKIKKKRKEISLNVTKGGGVLLIRSLLRNFSALLFNLPINQVDAKLQGV